MSTPLPRQEYAETPLTKHAVRGASSKTIFKFMTGAPMKRDDHPWDVDDFERNRALLLCYPEWRARLPEMASLGVAWANLTARWADIEAVYDVDEQACNTFIWALVTRDKE